MHVLEAIRMSEEKMQGRKDFFLCSCFVSLREFSEPEEWTVLFYSRKSGNLIECTCRGGGVDVSDEIRAVSEIDRLDKSLVLKDEMHAIERVRNDLAGMPINILVSLHTKDGRAVWTMSAVMQNLSVTIYDINAATGDIIRKETTGLVRRL